MIAATMRSEIYASPRAWIGPVNGAPGLVQQGYLICGDKVPGMPRRAGCPTGSAHWLSVRDHGGQDVPVLVDEMPAATAGHHQAAGSLIGGEFPIPRRAGLLGAAAPGRAVLHWDAPAPCPSGDGLP